MPIQYKKPELLTKQMQCKLLAYKHLLKWDLAGTFLKSLTINASKKK